MVVLNALRRTPGAIRRNPVLFVPVLVLLLFQVPQLVLQSTNPFLASVVSAGISLVFVFVVPFFQGGLVGMAAEALDGSTSMQTFLAEGRGHYVSLLIGYLVLVAVNFVVGFVAFVAGIVGGIAFFTDAVGSVGLVVLVVAGGIVALAVLAYLVLVFFVQFYGHAIVLDDLGVAEGFGHSVSLVRHNLWSTFGYSLLVGGLGGVAGVVFGIASVLSSPRPPTSVPVVVPELSMEAVVAGATIALLIGSLFGAFFGVFSVAFYRSIDVSRSDHV